MDERVEWNRIHLSNHFSKLTRPTAWYESAIELVAAAEVLAPLVRAWWDSLARWQKDKEQVFNEHSFHRTYLMLNAFAIENYCKGALVTSLTGDEREALRVSGAFPDRLRSHKVLDLVGAVGISISTLDDEALCRRLAHAAVWDGRYPVSTDYKAAIRERFSDGNEYSLTYLARADVEKARSFTIRVRDHVGARASYRVRRTGV